MFTIICAKSSQQGSIENTYHRLYLIDPKGYCTRMYLSGWYIPSCHLVHAISLICARTNPLHLSLVGPTTLLREIQKCPTIGHSYYPFHWLLWSHLSWITYITCSVQSIACTYMNQDACIATTSTMRSCVRELWVSNSHTFSLTRSRYHACPLDSRVVRNSPRCQKHNSQLKTLKNNKQSTFRVYRKFYIQNLKTT